MFHSLPSHLITQTTFSKEVEGVEYDYTITHTVFGEVLHVENHFLQLPLTAKQLLVGSKHEAIAIYLENYKKLFRFLVPLAIMRYLKEQEWELFYEKTDSEINFQTSFDIATLDKLISDKWLLRAWKLKIRDENNDLKHFIEYVYFPNKRNDDFYSKFKKLDSELVGISLIHYLPFVENKDHKIQIYKTLYELPSQEVSTILLNNLKEERLREFHSYILQALIPYKSEQIKKTAIDYYKNNIQSLNSRELAAIPSLLKYYLEDNNVQAVLFEILKSEFHAAVLSAKVLKYNLPASQKMIAQTARQSLDNKTSVGVVKTALAIFELLDDVNYLPSPNEILDILIWALEHNPKSLIYGVCSDLIYKWLYVKHHVFHEEYNKRIQQFLTSSSVSLHEGLLSFLRFCGTPEHLNMVLNYWNNKNNSQENRISALRTIERILFRAPSSKWLPQLLKMNEYGTTPEKIEVLEAIKNIVESYPDNVVIPCALKELKHPEGRVRENAVLILKYFPQPNIIEAIMELKNDPSEWVRNIVLGAMKNFENPDYSKNRLKQFRQIWDEAHNKFETRYIAEPSLNLDD